MADPQEIERDGQDIIEKYKEYKHNPEAMDAMTDILVFMGIIEAPLLHEEAVKQIEAETLQLKDARKEYAQHIAQGAKHYISFENYIAKKKTGLL